MKKRVLLIIGGGIAAYKCLELIRRGAERGLAFRVVMTSAAQHFVTPLSAASLTNDKVHTDLFSLTDEAEIGHIRLAREADLVLVAPATADLLAKMAAGLADDLATTLLLATDKPVLAAPSMNPFMWRHPATRRNVATLRADGVRLVGPDAGDMACHETGAGRMAEPHVILDAIETLLAADAARPVAANEKPLAGRRAVVTSGPTHEAIDPVRFIANRSSGRQGHAIASALASAGAEVTLVTGPVGLAHPQGVRVVEVTSALEMQAAVEAELPVDIAVCAAAVADWRPASIAPHKLKKAAGEGANVALVANPDILASLGQRETGRPRLVVGFAAETRDLEAAGRAKLESKGCDLILANDVSAEHEVFGGERNEVLVIAREGDSELWPRAGKEEVARRLVERIAVELAGPARQPAAPSDGRPATRRDAPAKEPALG